MLIKNAETLERVDTLLVDKTGTLTEGKPRLMHVAAVSGDEVSLLRVAAALERGSEHPLASAIVAGAEERALRRVSDFQAVAGKGVTARVDGELAALYNVVGVPIAAGSCTQCSASR